MLAHDEVRQRPAIALDVADKPQRHPGAGLVLDANDLGNKMKRLFAGEIEVDLGGLARTKLPRGSHEQAIARHIFDETVDDDAVCAELSANADRDSNSCPLVHVVKATLATYQPDCNVLSYTSLVMHRGEIVPLGRTFSEQRIAFWGAVRQIATPKWGP